MIRSGIGGHQCKQGRLLIIETIDKSTHSKIDSGESENIEDLMVVIVHALADYSNPQTMRVSEYLKHQRVTVLIDTGSINNFLHGDVAKRLLIPMELCDQFEVKLADGRTLTCQGKCSRATLLVQDQ